MTVGEVVSNVLAIAWWLLAGGVLLFEVIVALRHVDEGMDDDDE